MSVDADSPLATLVQPADVISAIDNEAIQSSEQAVKILNQRADHVQSMISLDRLVNGVMRTANGPGAVMNPLTSALETLAAGRQPVTSKRAARPFATMLDGEASDATVAAFLTALRIKGETADELEGAVAAVRERMIRWESGMIARSTARYLRHRG